MKMKVLESNRSPLVAISLIAMFIGLVSCGTDLNELADRAEQSAMEDDAEMQGEEYGLFGDENETYAKEGEERTEEEILVVDTLIQLNDAMRLKVAECAGISDEVTAFSEKVEALKSSGADHEEIREQLKEDHEALRKVMDDNEEAVRECKEELKESEELLDSRSILEACFEKPRKKHGKGGHHDNRRGPRGMEEGPKFGLSDSREGPEKGKKDEKHRLPPRGFGKFQDEGCQAAVSAVLEL